MAGRQVALERAIARWRLEVDETPIETPRGTIVLGRRDGIDVALKMPRVDDEAAAGRVLEAYAGDGAVRVLAHADDTLLLERAVPGEHLSDLVRLGQDAEATDILCGVAQRLHARPPPAGAFGTIEIWGRAFDAYAASGDATIPPATVNRAARLYAHLAATQEARRLLHGDLHQHNVLRDAERGWLAIDPKGVLGEPAYELGAMLRNPYDQPGLCADTAIVVRRVRQASAHLNLDRDRVVGWAYAQAVLAGIWSWEDGEPVTPWQPIIDAIAPLLSD